MNGKRLTLLVAAAILVLWPAAGNASGAGRPVQLGGGDPLKRLRSERLPVPGTELVPQSPGRSGGSRRAGLIWLALVSVPTLIIVLSALQAKRPLRRAQVGVPSPEGGVQMRRRFIERKVDGDAQDERVAGHSGAEPGGRSLASRLQGYTTEPIVEPPSPVGPDDVKDEHVPTFSELGEHVASVLEKAREAAERIQAEARSEAAQVLERAQADAEERLATARRKAEELEAEAAQARSESNQVAEDVRSRADAYAQEKRQEADDAAAQITARAERLARERARAADERHRALSANVERTEERLRRLVTGLRELAGRLDVLVGSDGLTELSALESDPSAPVLDETLRQQVAAGEQPEETGSATESNARET